MRVTECSVELRWTVQVGRWVGAFLEPRKQRVVVAAPTPFETNHFAVTGESGLPVLPHLSGGMVFPTVVGLSQRKVNLLCLNSLLAETLAVEDGGGLSKVSVWQECLHAPTCNQTDSLSNS